MLHESRALRRASDAASARVTARRPMMILGTAAATLLGITLTAGIVSVPASGSELPDPGAAVAQLVTGAEPHAKIADEAAIPLIEAKDAVLDAQALGYHVAVSGLDVSAAPAVDVSELQDDMDALKDRDTMSPLVVTVLTEQVEAATTALVSDTATLQDAFTGMLRRHPQLRVGFRAVEHAEDDPAPEATAV